MLSFVSLHVPQSIIQVVNVLNADAFVDFFSAQDIFGLVHPQCENGQAVC